MSFLPGVNQLFSSFPPNSSIPPPADRHPMIADATNTRRATPERVLWFFAAFALLAAVAAVRDASRRTSLESTSPVRESPVTTK